MHATSLCLPEAVGVSACRCSVLSYVVSCYRSWKDNVCQTKVARAHAALKHNLFVANPVLQVGIASLDLLTCMQACQLTLWHVVSQVHHTMHHAALVQTAVCDARCSMCLENLQLATHGTLHNTKLHFTTQLALLMNKKGCCSRLCS